MGDSQAANQPERISKDSLGTGGFLSASAGVTLTILFYTAVYFIPWAPLQRYFLGHPVAIAATGLFFIALSVLVSKRLAILDQQSRLATLHDEALRPNHDAETPASKWLSENDAGHVARRWLLDLGKLPSATRNSRLVQRLEELLHRQSQRGTAKHLADDLRELSGRDLDAAHDSLGLVRIIVWAIPMLGFLGTVIGITQTLGGLDFSNGTAAVDNLKSGLYVAFDTTALGLVLSVVAIFLQFPVERSEQRLLAQIDTRVGNLASSCLPSDEASDNQTVLIADLCKGVQAAVAESLDNQTRLWKETIDAAQQQWQSAHDHNTNRLAEAFELTLVPALMEHSDALADSSKQAANQLSIESEKWQAMMNDACEKLEAANHAVADRLAENLDSALKPMLADHAEAIGTSSSDAAGRLEKTWDQWLESIDYHSGALVSQQQTLTRQFEALTETHDRADSIIALNSRIDENLTKLDETNQAIDESVKSAAGDGMADAMRILARAVDVLSARLAESSETDSVDATQARKAA